MKRLLLLSALVGMTIALLNVSGMAQVAVNTDNSAPDGTSMLDVKSTSRGMLIPRMTIAQRDAIVSPAKGLMVFCTDNSQYYYNAGTPASKNWVMMNTQWLNNGTNLYYNIGNVGIGLSNPAYMLDVRNAALGGVAGNTVPWLRVSGPASNNDQLRMLHSRYAAGADWRTAEIRLQRTVDAADLHFISFRGTSSGMGNLVFGFQTTDQFVLESGGNVGIGTTDPGQKLSVAGQLGLLETDATPVYYSVLQSGNISSQLTFTLPNGYGSSGQVLTTNGSGVMSWSSGEVPLTFTNGLTRSGATAKLGGTLTESTTIAQPGSLGLNFVNSGSANTVFNLTGTGDLDIQDNGTSIFFVSDEGNIGIGSTSPYAKMDIIGNIVQSYPGSGNGIIVSGTTPLAIAYFENNYPGNTWGLSAGCYSSSAGNDSYGVFGFNFGTGYGAYGKSFNPNGTGVYGINTADYTSGYLGGDYGVYGRDILGGNFGYIGGPNYSVYGNLITSNQGDYAVYGYGVASSGLDGTGYTYLTTLGGVKGYTYYGNPYTFGTAGFSFLDYGRSGGVFGSSYSGTSWGSLCYKNSSGSIYGGYFTSYTSGTGKSSHVMIYSGIGAWGDLFGADIHGKVYGLYVEGSDYGSFTNGDVYKTGLDIHLQKEDNGKNIPLYTNVSTDATIQTCGYAILSDGTCRIEFDPSFTAAVSSSSPVIVTVTPMGKTEGVYLSEVSPAGFSVAENHDGKSSVQVSYIAVGKRAGYESPVLPEAVVAGDYVDKLNAGLHNDNDTQTNGAGLWYENGQLHNSIHPSTLPDPNKPAVDPDQRGTEQLAKPANRKPVDRGVGRAVGSQQSAAGSRQ